VNFFGVASSPLIVELSWLVFRLLDFLFPPNTVSTSCGLNFELEELLLELSLLLFCEVSIGCGANRRVAGLASEAASFRDDFVDVSTGSTANLLGAGLSSEDAASFREDFEVVSIGSGANRRTLAAPSSSGECFRLFLEDFVLVSTG
jgi:hypothetical protein